MLGVHGTFDIRVWVLRCVEYIEHDFVSDCCVKEVMHKPSFDVSSALPHGFTWRHPHATQRPPQVPDRKEVTLCVHVQIVYLAPNR